MELLALLPAAPACGRVYYDEEVEVGVYPRCTIVSAIACTAAEADSATFCNISKLGQPVAVASSDGSASSFSLPRLYLIDRAAPLHLRPLFCDGEHNSEVENDSEDSLAGEAALVMPASADALLRSGILL